MNRIERYDRLIAEIEEKRRAEIARSRRKINEARRKEKLEQLAALAEAADRDDDEAIAFQRYLQRIVEERRRLKASKDGGPEV